MNNVPDIPTDKPLLLFDGVCNLCNGAVQWVIRHDPAGKIHFAALQSNTGQQVLRQAGLSGEQLSSVVLYYQDRLYTRSDAALELLRLLGGFWSFFYLFRIIPRFVRDTIYEWIARNRYRWFGKREECMIPTPELKSRFLN